MNLRRLLTLAVAIVFVPVSALVVGSTLAAVTGTSAGSVLSRVAAMARCREATATTLAAAPAAAQEVLEFEPIDPESARAIEQVRGIRRRVRDTIDVRGSTRTDIQVGRSGNVMRVGNDIHVDVNEVVVGDVLAVAGDVSVEGHVQGDVVAMAGDVRLASTARVDGDVVCMGGKLIEETGASVGGQRVTAGSRARRHESRETHVVRDRGVGGWMGWVLMMLLAAWVLTKLAAGRTQAALTTLKSEPALSLGIGFLILALLVPSLIALALVVALLCITIIGIPLALAALLGYFAFLCLLWLWGFVVAAVAVGDAVTRRMQPRPAAVPGAPAAVAPEASLTRRAVFGVLVLLGSGLVGAIFSSIGLLGPISGLGGFVCVLSIVGSSIATAFGGGAWLRSELASGVLGRWWRGSRKTPATATSAPASAPSPMASASTEPPQAPPPPSVPPPTGATP